MASTKNRQTAKRSVKGATETPSRTSNAASPAAEAQPKRGRRTAKAAKTSTAKKGRTGKLTPVSGPAAGTSLGHFGTGSAARSAKARSKAQSSKARSTKARSAAPLPARRLAQADVEGHGVYVDLSAARVAPVRNAMKQIAELLSQPDSRQAESAAAFQQRAQAAVDAFRVIALGNGRQVQSVLDALEQAAPEDADAADLGEAEARGRLRLHALYNKIVDDSYSVAELGETWRISRQRLAQLRNEDRLFAINVPYQRGMLYPHWQFGPDQRPRPIMSNLIKEAKDSGLDAIGFHQLMTSPASGDRVAPVQMLDEGQEELVLGIVRASDA